MESHSCVAMMAALVIWPLTRAMRRKRQQQQKHTKLYFNPRQKKENTARHAMLAIFKTSS